MSGIEREQLPLPPPLGGDGIPASARGRSGSAVQAFAACVVGAVFLALLTSPDLLSWAERSSDGSLAPVVQEIAARWDDEVGRLGLSLPHEALRRVVEW